jgi:hypothetical protein
MVTSGSHLVELFFLPRSMALDTSRLPAPIVMFLNFFKTGQVGARGTTDRHYYSSTLQFLLTGLGPFSVFRSWVLKSVPPPGRLGGELCSSVSLGSPIHVTWDGGSWLADGGQGANSTFKVRASRFDPGALFGGLCAKAPPELLTTPGTFPTWCAMVGETITSRLIRVRLVVDSGPAPRQARQWASEQGSIFTPLTTVNWRSERAVGLSLRLSQTPQLCGSRNHPGLVSTFHA